MSKAYQLNSTLNFNRAGVRVTDENVPIAKSGYRPTIGASGSIDYSSIETNVGSRRLTTGSFGVEINQMLFDGFQTRNNVRAAEAQVRASVESLRNDEQNTLFDAASAYMDVIRDRQIAVLTEQNLQFLTEQSRAARSRFEVGEGTRTDVAQADASRSAAVAQLAAARAQAEASEATYRQVDRRRPRPAAGRAAAGQDAAQEHRPGDRDRRRRSSRDHRDRASGRCGRLHREVDRGPPAAAGFGVGRRGAQLPEHRGPAGRRQRQSDGTFNSASIGATLTIPIYTGGRVSAQVRQSKESLGQARIEVDVSRDQVRQAVVSAWTQYVAARESVSANRELVAAQQLALNGVIEERNVGQRTTLDVLDAQADVITAQINLVEFASATWWWRAMPSSRRSARLSAERLGLQVAIHRPQEHYDAVKDKWGGLRTPDGR